MPLNCSYRLVLPGVISNKRDSDQPARIVNNQAEFNLGLVVRLAHKIDKSLVIAVKVERQ